ncbi:MAG: hypothetical protein HC907_17935 [Richelia sp. SM1_7_0]|nr:hypothetical protein [Richelia sp. SM1_7_0]
MSRVIDIQRQQLEEELANLTEQYTAVNKQRRQTLDERERLLLKKQADDLLEQMQQVEEELGKLENSQDNYNQNYRNIQENLPQIDFRKAMHIIDIINNQFKRDVGAAFFLLEESYSMAGELLIYKIREELKSKTRNLKHIKVEISSNNSFDEFGLLASIGGYLSVSLTDDTNLIDCVNLIIQTISQSLQSGSVIFIEIKRWDCFPYQDKILSWFIEDFWCSLIHECQMVATQKQLLRIKFIAIIDSESKLAPECKELPFYCTQDDFTHTKILTLPLNIWELEDITTWLEYYSGLSAPQINLKAKQIYQKTMNGVPRMVCNLLEEEF